MIIQPILGFVFENSHEDHWWGLNGQNWTLRNDCEIWPWFVDKFPMDSDLEKKLKIAS